MAALSQAELPRSCVAALALVVPGCEGDAPGTVAGPMAVTAPGVDFGRVFEGTVLEHEWDCRVQAATAVSAAKTDCGCTLARLERAGGTGRLPYELGAPLEAGERLFVTLRYDTRGRRGPASRSVRLDLAGDVVLPLTLAADVQPWLLVEPQDLPFERVLEGQGAECTFRVRSASGAPVLLHPTGVALPPWVTLELTPEDPDAVGRARAWSAHGRLGPETPRGTYHYPLEVASDEVIPGSLAAGAERRFSIAPGWRLQVVGPVALSSPNLEFGLVRADETVAKSVRLESFDPAFTPDAASAHLEPLERGGPFPLGRTAQVHLRPAGRACDIELVLAGLDSEVSGTFLARLVVETGHPALPRLEALVRGVRSPVGEPR